MQNEGKSFSRCGRESGESPSTLKAKGFGCEGGEQEKDHARSSANSQVRGCSEQISC